MPQLRILSSRQALHSLLDQSVSAVGFATQAGYVRLGSMQKKNTLRSQTNQPTNQPTSGCDLTNLNTT